MKDSKPLIITGMHRSGTSLIAQSFFRAGLFMGNNLHPPNRFNPDGYFEDLNIIQFHDAMLAACGANAFVGKSLKNIKTTDQHKNQAMRLMLDKFSDQHVWGWKEPRAALFLDFWNAIFPEAKWIFVFRNPSEVAWSLLRRRDFKNKARTRLGEALLSLRLWVEYNKCILKFAKKHPEQCLFIFSPYDYEIKTQQGISQFLQQEWGFKAVPVDWTSLYKKPLMQSTPPSWICALAQFHPAASRIFNGLKKIYQEQRSLRVRGLIRNA